MTTCTATRRWLLIEPVPAPETERGPDLAPDVPTAVESGYPGMVYNSWYGVWAPKGTPADAQARATEEIRKAVSTDEAKAVWANQGAEFANVSGPQFDAFIKGEIRKWAAVVKTSGAKLD